MNCPVCHHDESRVTHTDDQGKEIVRRRRCSQCGHPFETIEQTAVALERSRAVESKARELADIVKAG